MIEITELRPSACGRGWTFTVTLNGQDVPGNLLTETYPRALRMCQAAAAIDWGEHCLVDVQTAVETKLSEIGAPRNV